MKNILKNRYGQINFKLVDLICLSYVSLIGVFIVIFHQNVTNWKIYFFVHLFLLLIILETVRFAEANPHWKFSILLRILYPLVIFFYSWHELNVTVVMLFGNHWATEPIVTIDKALFGVHPTVWIAKYYNPILDEIMNIFYSGYYLFAPILVFTLFFSNRYSELYAILAIITFTFFTNFVVFHLLPALGPQMVVSLKNMDSGEYSGYWIASLTKYFQSKGSVRGACFPSSHISAATVWSLSALRYKKKIGLFFAPFTVGVAISTVYLGYHHAIDPIFGFLWGMFGYWVSLKLLKIRNEDPKILNSNQNH